MMKNSGSGSKSFGPDRAFNGVKVFSATMVNDRTKLGDRVTHWLQSNPQCEARDLVVTQSSDRSFHCLAFTLFYWETLS